MEVKINREIRSYTESIFFGLSIRQFIFACIGCGMAVLLYFIFKPIFGVETLSWACMVGAAPFIACGFITYNGMTAEQFAIAWVKSKFIEPIKVKFECSTLYADAYKTKAKEEKQNDDEDKQEMFLQYSELLNSLDSEAITKITINNRKLNKEDFERHILINEKDDNLFEYRREYNAMLTDKASGVNGIIQEKYLTVSIVKKDLKSAQEYFKRIEKDMKNHLAKIGSICEELDTTERLRILHDFYRAGEESDFHFDLKDTMKKGHDFKDYICPDSMERADDYIKLGDKYARVFWNSENS